MGSSASQVGENGPTGHVMNRWWIVLGGVMMNMALGTFYAVSAFLTPAGKGIPLDASANFPGDDLRNRDDRQLVLRRWHSE